MKDRHRRIHKHTYQVLRCDWLSRATGSHHHAGQADPHVPQAVGQGQDGHDLTGHRDVEARLEEAEGHTDTRTHTRLENAMCEWG